MLIQKMCSQKNNDANEEFISSILFPFLTFVFQLVTPELPLSINIEESVASIFEQILFKADTLKQLKVENTINVMRLYVQSQLHLFSKILRQRIRDTLID